MNCSKCGSVMQATELFTSTVWDCASCAGIDYGPHAELWLIKDQALAMWPDCQVFAQKCSDGVDA